MAAGKLLNKQDMKSLTVRLLIVTAFALGVEGNKVQKDPFEEFFIHCSANETIKKIIASPSNDKHDRIWSFVCSPLDVHSKQTDCHWTGQNEHSPSEPHVFQCPGNSYVVAVRSKYYKERIDRHFEFACCETQNYFVHGGSLTPWENTLPVFTKHFQVPKRMVLKGVISYYDIKTSDRRFRFKVCYIGSLPND